MIIIHSYLYMYNIFYFSELSLNNLTLLNNIVIRVNIMKKEINKN